MLIQLFKPITNLSQTFQSNKIGDITTYSSFLYEPNFYSYGTFSLRIPIGTRFANLMEENTLLFIDYKYWLIVRDVISVVSSDMYEYEISGTDLKGITNDRITLYPSSAIQGTQGFDVCVGSSEFVMKHYVDFNMINTTDPSRKILGLENANNQNRGISNDTYMSRFEKVGDLMTKVGTNAKLGYDIKVDLSRNKFVFDVAPSIDKTENQFERNRIVFDIERGNVKELKIENKSSTGKNALYATKSGGSLEADAVTQLVVEDEVPSGIFRREMQLNVSCEKIDEIGIYARKDIGNYANILSFEQRVVPTGFGTLYNLGDFVTVKNSKLGISKDVQIVGAKISLEELVLVFNQPSLKPFDLFNQKLKNRGV